jgi:hypothetical protein
MKQPEEALLDASRAGWTLVEAAVGMLVGTVALIALAGVLVSMSYLHSLSLSKMELTSVGEAQLDQLRSHAALQTADTLRLGVGGSLSTNMADHNTQVTTARGRTYNVRWRVAAGVSGTRNVTVRVAPVGPRRNEVPLMEFNTLMLIR